MAILATQSLWTFDTIKDILKYANKYDEYPDSDLDLEGQNAQINPTFRIFYPTIDPGFFARIGCHFGIFKPLWCFSDFMKAMQNMYEREQGRAWQTNPEVKGQFFKTSVATVIGCVNDDTNIFILVGELSGAFHSLARIIAHWYETGIIDERMTLKNDKTHIIFLGNVVGSSAYNLEALTLLGTISARNPNNIWYLCGAYEDRQRWHESPLHHAIDIRSRLNRNGRRATYKLVDDIFSLLPDAFIITSSSHTEAIVCSAVQVFENIVPSEAAGCIKQFTPKEIKGCALSHDSGGKDTYAVLSLIETRRKWETLFVTPPLEKIAIPSIKGPVWDLISGTTRGLQAIYRVRWNGYVILRPRGEHLEKSTIEYIGRRADFDDTFKSHETYNVVTGELITEKQDAVQSTGVGNLRPENTTSKTPQLK